MQAEKLLGNGKHVSYLLDHVRIMKFAPLAKKCIETNRICMYKSNKKEM